MFGIVRDEIVKVIKSRPGNLLDHIDKDFWVIAVKLGTHRSFLGGGTNHSFILYSKHLLNTKYMQAPK